MVSSLVFHHLPRAVKQAAVAESLRVLKVGGRLHIADFGRPSTVLARLATLPVRVLDGGATTADNFEGRLPQLMEAARFNEVEEAGNFLTVFGPVCFYRAVKR